MAEMTDRRVARTRKALHGALMSLILRKGYEAVTVQDIVDEADVGRSTFYAHYTGKEDLLRGGFQTVRRLLAEAQRDAVARGRERASSGDVLAFSLSMFEHAAAYRDVYRAMVGGRGGVIAVQELRQIFSEVVRKELKDIRDNGALPRELVVQFVVDGFLTVLTWWLERRPELGPDEVDAMFHRLVIGGVGPAIRLSPGVPGTGL